MPIKIADSPEPLSLTSRTYDCVLAESEASVLLKKEMRLYCERQITGRSFLIAGHRGSGKTTLVQNAFLQVLKDKRGPAALTPLLVPLNGPSLLPREEDKPREPVPQTAEKPPVAENPAPPPEPVKDRPKSTPQIALEQITLGIYQALAQELSHQFRQRVLQPDMLRHPERLELAAQLEVELYEYPEPARLREIWERAGVLETGVLFPDNAGRLADQGLRELVALTGACEAYRRISGTFKQTDTSTTEGSAKSQLSVALESSKELFSSLASLLTGGLVGAGTFAANHSPVPAALTGLATALGAALVFKVSETRTRDRTGKRESTFVLDTSVPTLERVLPILVSRLRDAGLTPIFLVDELDKVEDLSVRMKELVPQLKKFVSESTFFCFLVDRNYFETMKRLWDESTFPVEYTYFTHQLYVLLRAEDLHDYLGKILEAPQVLPPAGELLEGEAAAARKLAESTAREQISETAADYPVLPYILLHRSRMHPIDLRRELALLRDPENNVKLLPGRVRSAPAFRVDLILQIAIEMVLDDDRLAQELECHPVFRRLAYDSLYYLSWMWQREKDLDLGDENRSAFETYLAGRMGQDKKGIQLPENDLRFLYDKVRQIAELVADLQSRYLAAFTHWKDERIKRGRPLAAEVETALALKFSPPPPLERETGKPWGFRWRVDASGLPLDEKQEDEENLLPVGSSPELPVWDKVDLIEDLARGLGRLRQGNGDAGRISFTKLTSELRILSTTPAWAETERAIARLNKLKTDWRSYPEFAEDSACVDAFAAMLLRNGQLLADALFSSAVLGTVSARQNAGERLVLGLLEVSRLNRLADLQEKESGERLQVLAKSLRKEIGLPPAESPSLSQGAEGWLEEVRKLMTAAEKADLSKAKALPERRKAAWTRWETLLAPVSLRPNAGYPSPAIPSVDDLVCAVSNVSPANLLKPHLGEMTLVGWSEVLYWALADVPVDVPCYTPIWMLYPALLALGFPQGSWALPVNALVAGEISYSRRPLEDEMPILKDWDNRPDPPPAPLPRLLILRKTEGSALADWKPSRRGAAIVLDISIASHLERSLPAPIASLESFVPIDRIAIEIGAGDGAAPAAHPTHRALERMARAKGRQPPRPPLQFRTEPGEERNVVARSLDELLALAALPDSP